MVIDSSNARRGLAGLDVDMTALVLAQIVTYPEIVTGEPGLVRSLGCVSWLGREAQPSSPPCASPAQNGGGVSRSGDGIGLRPGLRRVTAPSASSTYLRPVGVVQVRRPRPSTA